MSRQFSIFCFVLTTSLATTVGCKPQQPFYLFEDRDMSHYLGQATEIEYPDVDIASLDEVTGAMPPLTLENPDPSQILSMTLEEAVHLALENSKVIRRFTRVQFTDGGPVGVEDGLLTSPDRPLTPTVYDPALTETNPRFGVPAAISDFDPRLSFSSNWEKNVAPQNTAGFVQAFRPRVFQQDLGTFQAQLSKQTATGGIWSLTHNVDYEWNNITQISRQYPSDWNVNLEAQFRQPLLHRNGVQFNRIAGPTGIPGFNNGVIIARIAADISLTDFESNVQNLVSDVERAYWHLYLAYRRLDALRDGRERSHNAWYKEKTAFDEGGFRTKSGQIVGRKENVALTRHQYIQFQELVEIAQSDLFKAQRLLRQIIGLTSSDGKLIRPSEEPTSARIHFDWYETHAEALSRNPRLRRQRWRVKEADLALSVAKNYLLPRLDAVARYRYRGLGDRLMDSSNSVTDFRFPMSNAYGSMTTGNFQEWQLGLELNIPLGFRKETAGVRHAQLTLSREKAVAKEQERELTFALSDALSDLEKHYTQCQRALDRVAAAEEELAVWETIDEVGEYVDEFRRVAAQQRVADAEIAYYRSLVNYNLAVTQIHFRKGSLLEYNNVYLAEGPWPAKAYFDAVRRARARDASLYLDYGFTRPRVISRGAYDQHAGKHRVLPQAESDLPGRFGPELVPTPEPEPADFPAMPPTPIPDATSGLTGARPEMVAAGGAVPSPRGKDYDLGSMDLGLFERKPAETQLTSWVEPAENARDSAGENRAQVSQNSWRSIRRPGAGNEPVANPSSAEAPGNASGWKRIQH
ncbi:MAG: TolC family protein [Planctomycetota bacterium]